MNLLKDGLEKRKQDRLQKRIAIIEENNRELIKENQSLQSQIQSYKYQIDAFSELEETYKNGLEEIKSLREKYESAFKETNEIKAKYSKKMRDLIKQFKKEL